MNHLTIKIKLLLAFFLVGILPIVVLSIISVKVAGQGLEEQALEKLTAVQAIKKEEVEAFFKRVNIDIETLSTTTAVTDYVDTMEMFINSESPGETEDLAIEKSEFQKIWKDSGTYLLNFRNNYGYHDLMMITPDSGHVIFTAVQGADSGINLAKGAHETNSLAALWRRVVETGTSAMTDFAPYALDKGAMALFAGAPCYDAFDELIAVIVLRISPKAVDLIVNKRNGMGETGETFLAGSNGSPANPTLRSDRITTGATVGDPADTPWVKQAIKGESGKLITPDRDGSIVVFDGLTLTGLGWGIVSRVEKREALGAIFSLKLNIVVICLVSVSLIAVIGFLITRSIITPVNAVVTTLMDIAEGDGDLRVRLDVQSRDEIGELSRWFNIFIEKIQVIIKEVAENTAVLNRSSSGITRVTREMDKKATDTSELACDVSTNVSKMTLAMDSVATQMNSTNQSVGIIETATREMSATIKEIAENAGKTTAISNQAVTKVSHVTMELATFKTVAERINGITGTIRDISEQTNLLALNATIEAARAGDAGKGFAVVANEIKDLATQTQEATLNIRNQVQSVKAAMDTTISTVGEVSLVIKDVDALVGEIAAAVEEQSATTNEITGNLSTVFEGIHAVSREVTRTSRTTRDISGNVSVSSTSMNEISHLCSQVNRDSEAVFDQSENLKAMVNRFRT
ncbi:MAG: methyl-accepting chemotaxis protein [Desulfobacterium sp.]|nr:methyl-accepting chemotaxis protein [Desulfobacterium sp.]